MPDLQPLPELTIALITRNAAGVLAGALESIRGLAGQTLVVDTGSRDQTLEIARGHGAVRVHELETFPGFGPARAAALDLCATEWVLFLDADERVDPLLAADIRRVVELGPAESGWRVHRRNHVLGHPMRSMGLDRDRPLRLFRRAHGRVADTLVHEAVNVEGPVGQLRGRLEHFTLDSLEGYLRKIDLYTTLELRQRPRRLSRGHLALVAPGSFVKDMIFRGGWRDGVPGVIWAGLTAISRFTRDMKAWIAQQETHAKGPPRGDPR